MEPATSLSNLLTRVPGLLKGLKVRGQDGSYLGKVFQMASLGLEIEKGVIRHSYYYVHYTEITSAFGGSIYLWKGRDALIPLPKQLSIEELEKFGLTQVVQGKSVAKDAEIQRAA